RLHGARKRAADESDVVQSSFDSFFRAAEQGRFPRLTDRNDLWRLLVVITARKAIDLVQREKSLKNGGGKLAGESALLLGLGEDAEAGRPREGGHETAPPVAAEATPGCPRLLSRLPRGPIRPIPAWTLHS